MSHRKLGQLTPRRLTALIAGCLLAVLALAAASPASAADRAFTERYSTVTNGDILMTGNTSMSCPSSSQCTTARAGNTADNNDFNMAYVDVDSDALTVNSSSATVNIPSGATVLFAGLYWGGDSAALDVLRGAVKLDTPAAGGYIDLTADQIEGSTEVASQYGAFKNITSQVTAAGSGSYTVANVQGTPSTTRMFAGWSIVVAYRLASDPKNHLKVLDGLQRPSTTTPSVTIPITGLTTPASGTVNGELGMLVFDGDAGTTGEGMTLNGSNVTDALNAAGNQFNSSIGSAGTRISAKNPDYTNQLGVDIDTFTIDGLLANGSTSASLNLTSSNNEHYHVTALTLVNRAETTAPDTTISTGPSGATNTATPTWTFSSTEPGSTFECRIDGGAWTACNSGSYTASTLGQGSHTFDVRATDPQLNTDATPASRTISVDTNAPQTTIDSGPSGLIANTTPAWAFSSSEAGSTFQCRIDSGAWGSCTSPYTAAAQSQGSHTFEVRATDPAGNVDATPASRTVNVDTVAPDTTITSGPSGPTNSATPSWQFSSSESPATFQCRLDGGPWNPCTSAYNAGTLSAGAHTFDVRAIDAAGNTDASPATRSITIDLTAPDTTINTGPSGATNTATPTWTFSSNEAGSTFECRVDSGSWTACNAGTYTAAALSQGSHTFDVRATDSAGNVDATPASRSITVDTSAPDTTINTGPSGATNATTPTWTFSSSDAGSTFECRVDSGAYTACNSGSYTAATLSAGTHTFDVRATDPAGNVDPTPASRSITVDVAAPDTTILTGPSGPTSNATPTWTFSSNKAGSTFQCRVDSGAYTACNSGSYTASTLSAGPHTFDVRATDPAGNTDATPASRTITVDTSAPDTTINSGPSGATNTATPTWTFSSSEAGSTFECRIDSGSYAACNSGTFTASALSQGAHTFDVRATDSAGNVDATPASRSITVDTAAPDTNITGGPSGLTNNPAPSWTFTSTEPGSTFQCSIDGGAYAGCTSPYSASTLGDGAHTFAVRSVDAAGNQDATPATRSITVDATAPNTIIDTGPSGPANTATPTWTFSSTEGSSTFECRVDGGSWTACNSGSYTASTLSQGSHTFDVRATDAAGNVDATPASRTISVDTTAPDTTINTGPSGATANTTPTWTFSSNEAGATFQCRVDSGAYTACNSGSYTASTLSAGPHTFDVRATDLAGNVDATPASRSITVDTTAPDTTINTGPSGPTSTATPTWTFSSSEAGSTFECRVDSGAYSACNSGTYTASTLSQGPHTFDVRATDPAGNVDATPASRSISVDTTAPNTTIDSGPTGLINTQTPAWTFSSTESGGTFECRIDSGSWTACNAGTYTAATLSQGSHTFEVRAIDSAGNVDATPASRTVNVDSVAPDTTIAGGPSGLTGTQTPTWTFTSNEAGSTFECRIDSGSWTACNSGTYTAATLSQGSHSFDVRATDPAGNTDATPAGRTINVDSVAPETTINTGPTGPTTNTTPTWTFSSSEGSSTFECRIDSGAYSSCNSGTYTSSTLSQGSHTFDVRATDAAGNVDATPASRTITVDTTAPDTTINTGPSGPTNATTPTWTFSSNEAGSTFQCRIDGGAYTACNSGSYTASALAAGSHTFDVRSTDPAGNVDATPASRTITVDTGAPDTTINTGPSGATNTATPTWTFSSSEAGSTFECRVDSGSWTACNAGTFTASTLSQGSHTFDVRATDSAGNVDATPASRSITVDTTAPNTTIDSGPTGLINTQTPAWTFSSNEAGSTFGCRVDGGAWTACNSGTYTAATLSQGSHTFEVRATDAAGNVDATPASRTVNVDSVAPNTTIDSGPAGLVNTATPAWAFSSSETASTFECRIDSGAWTACNSGSYTAAVLSQGSHTFEVRATDSAANTDQTPASRTVNVDTAAPNTTIDSGPTGLTNDSTPTWAFSSTEAGSAFQCRIDGGAWNACSSPFTPAALADGSHTFDVRATDPAGNTDGTPASRTVNVDTASPDTAIDAGPSGLTGDSTPTWQFSSSEGGASFDCRIDGGAWNPCSSPFTAAPLADGSHTFEARSTDAAGNVDQTPASRAVNVDTNAPNTTIDSGPSGVTGDPTPTFTFSSDEPGGFECRVDGGAWSPCNSPETTAQLSDGSHTFEVRSIDAAGNVDGTPASRTIDVDTSAPPAVVLSDSDPDSPASDNSPRIKGDAEAGSTVRLYTDAACTSAIAASGTAAAFASPGLQVTVGDDSSTTFWATATDPAGNTSACSSSSLTYREDSTDPNTAIDAGPAGTVSDPTPTFEFSSDEPGATFECRVDGGAWAPCTSPETTSPLADGPHTFEVRSTDAAGNVDPTPASRAFEVDTVDPQTTIDAGPSGPTNDPTPTFEFSSDEPGSTFECRVDGGAWEACSSPVTLPSLPDGPHTFEVRSVDDAGNADGTPDQRSFDVDTSDPTVTIDAGPNGPTSDPTPEIEFSSDEPGTTFECRVDGGSWAPCTSPFTTDDLPDGPHTIEVRGTDPAGNTGAPDQVTFTVDTNAPNTTIDSGPSGVTGDPTPTFTFSSDEPGSTFECRVDGGAWAPCASPETTASLADGSHTFEVRAIDPAGNVDSTPGTRTIAVDTGAPGTTIEAGPSGPTNDPTPTFEFSSDEPGSTFECRVDGGAWGPCSSPVALPALPDGDHDFEVRSTDPAGNTGAPDSSSFSIDTQDPATTIDSGPSGTTGDATPTFSFSSNEPGVTFECRVDGGAWTPCSSPLTTDPLADGPHTVEVRATDGAGNVDATPAGRTFAVDTGAPATSIDAGPQGRTADRTPTFEFSSDEPGSTFECRVDGGPWTPCDSPHTTASLPDGDHTFEVRATDGSGNVDGTPESRSFTVDGTAPDTTITSGPNGTTINNPTPTFAFSSDEPNSTFECREDSGPWTPCTSTEQTAYLADGQHTWYVRATDEAGNTDGTPAQRSFTVDTGGPGATIDGGPSGPTNDPTPTFEFSSDEPGSTFECRVDGGAWQPCSSPATVGPLGEGDHTFEVRSIDGSGNPGAPDQRDFRIDTSAPDTTITSGPNGNTITTGTPTFAFTSTEDGSTFECREDSGPWAPCTSTEMTAYLADGPHTWSVRATDPAGNVDPTPAQRSFTVDTATPETSILTGPSGTTDDTTPTFTFDSSKPGATFECRVDGGAWTACSGAFTPSAPLPAGSHTFEVRSTDLNGTADPTPASRAFTIASATAPPEEEPELSGSLIGPAACQQLAPGPRAMVRRIPSVGRVRVKLASDGQVLGAAPLMVTATVPASRIKSVRYSLDGRRLSGTVRSAGYAQAIRPDQLAGATQHELKVQLSGRGSAAAPARRNSFSLRFTTLRCDAALTAQRKQRGRTTEVTMRVDTRRNMTGVTYSVPRKFVPRPRANASAGSLLVQTAAGAVSYPMTFGAGGVINGLPAPLRVTLSGSTASVTGLPAGTRIVALALKSTSRRKAAPTAGRIRATISGDAPLTVSTRLKGRRR